MILMMVGTGVVVMGMPYLMANNPFFQLIIYCS